VISLGGVRMRQVPLQLGWAPPTPGSFLSQAAQAPFKVAVIDVRGNAFTGVKVSLPDGQTAVTDDNGVATFNTPPRGEVDVTLAIDGLTIVRHGNTNQSLFVDLPICGTPKILTNTELIALLAGAAVVAAGTYWKYKPIQMTGEILVGASLFTAIYRHSCVW